MKLIVGFAFTYPSIIDLSTENFMTGYRIVFDREKLVLGWKKFDCRCYFHFCTFDFNLQITILLIDQRLGNLIQVMTLMILEIPCENPTPPLCHLLLQLDWITILPRNQQSRQSKSRLQMHHHHIIATPLF